MEVREEGSFRSVLNLLVVHKRGLLQELKALVESQKELWQQVPWLALQEQLPAPDYSEKLSNAYGTYGDKRWPIHNFKGLKPSEYPIAHIDLQSGKFVEPIPDVILLMILDEIDLVNAQCVINGLYIFRTRRTPYDSNELYEFRLRLQRTYGVKKPKSLQ